MEDLTRRQAIELKRTFKEAASPELAACLGGIGLCKIQQDPLIWGIQVNVREAVDETHVLAGLPPEFHDNVLVRVIGQAGTQA